jgi:VanZ family protein
MLKKHWKSLAWAVIVFIACSVPGNQVPDVSLINIPHFDKIVHFILFFVLTILLVSEFNKLNLEKKTLSIAYLWSAFISICYGVAIEALQHFVFASRSASLWDVLANSLGVLFAILVYRYVNRTTKGFI